MKPWTKCHGLIAATFTPMNSDGSLNLDAVEPYIKELLKAGVKQVYINGSAAEHASLTVPERKALAEQWMKVGRTHLERIIIHCGTGNLEDTKILAAHAEEVGADAVAVIGPTYYKPETLDAVVAYLSEAAKSCPETPFLYYHYPALTGINIRLTDLFKTASEVIPNFVGAKHTSMDLWDAAEASRVQDSKYDVIVGGETMLLGSFAMGLDSAIGISFSLLGKTCNRILEAYQKGDLEAARKEQAKVQDFWSQTTGAGGVQSMISSFKEIMNFCGFDVGPPRLPIQRPCPKRRDELKKIVADMGLTSCEE